MALRDRLHDGQSEAEPAGMPASARIGAREPIEDPVEVGRRDPRARVADPDHRFATATLDARLDRVRLTGVLHRVLDHRVERDREPVGVGQHRRLLGGTQLPPSWRRRPAADGLHHQPLHVDGHHVPLEIGRAREEQEAIDEAAEPHQLVGDHRGVLRRSWGPRPVAGSARHGRARP